MDSALSHGETSSEGWGFDLTGEPRAACAQGTELAARAPHAAARMKAHWAGGSATNKRRGHWPQCRGEATLPRRMDGSRTSQLLPPSRRSHWQTASGTSLFYLADTSADEEKVWWGTFVEPGAELSPPRRQ